MIASMTGFGSGRAAADGVSAEVEIRSVNKRHLNVSVRLPGSLSAREGDVAARVKDAFERGQLTVQVDVEVTDPEAVPMEVDPEAAVRIKQLLERLSAATQIQEPVRMDHLLAFKDVVFAAADEDEAAVDPDAVWPAVEAAVDEAIEDLRAMRRQEGQALQSDLSDRIAALGKHLDAVEERAPDRVEERQERLRERLGDLLSDERIDPDRLETEVALLADKLDVTEECVRLRSHLEMFEEALADDDPTGRKLKFITQEIHREANTIGAKADDGLISRHAVQMKEEIEKIREQIRNVE
jgi:uncharacterized protein (TIGR00255 family)